MNSIPVLLDTDIASDIDDAVALAYLLKQPRCELLGITTVSGDVQKRAACCQVLCQAAGREDIAIHCGTSDVLLCGQGQPNVPHYDAIAKRPHRKNWPQNTAVEFMRQTIRLRPGEITLLSIGPMANVALLFALDPEIPSLLKQWVSMSGYFFNPENQREWNILIDPIAAAMAHRARPQRHLSVGLDVTLQCQMPAELVRQKFAASPLNLVLEMAEVWFTNAKTITFHDPLAAALLFEPDLCGYEQGQIEIPLALEADRQGRTVFTARADGPHTVAKTVNRDGFFQEYFRYF